MQHQVKYQFQASIDAMDAAMKVVLGDKATPCYRTDWVELCDAMYEENERYAMIQFPNKRHPELTRALFFQIMCAALPLSKHDDTGFFVTAFADVEKDGKPVTAAYFQDSYQPEWERQKREGHQGTFWLKGELFAEELQNRLNAIAKIAGRGEEW